MKGLMNNLVLSVAVMAMGISATLSAKEVAEKGNNKPLKEWYMSNSVAVADSKGKIHTESQPAIFGRLAESKDAYDKHDIGTYGSVMGRPAAVVFVNSRGKKPGEYHSDYHDMNGQNDSWEMTVFSSVPNAEVKLSWSGLYELTPKQGKRGWNEQKVLDGHTLEDLKLIDTETAEVIQAVTDGKLNTHSFTMGAKGYRTFFWVLGSADTRHFAPAKGTQRYINLSKRKSRMQAKSVSAQAKQGHKGIAPPPF